MAEAVQVEQVSMVCPHIAREDIERDLSVTGDAQATINRIFEGNFLVGVPSPSHEFEDEPVSFGDLCLPAVPCNIPDERDKSGIKNDVVELTTLCNNKTDNARIHASTLTRTSESVNSEHQRRQPLSDDDSDCDELPNIWLHCRPVRKQSSTRYDQGNSSIVHSKDLHSSSTDLGFQSPPTEIVVKADSPAFSQVLSIGNEEQYVDLTLTPEKISNLEVRPSTPIPRGESPISLSSEECGDSNAGLESEDQTSYTGTSQDPNCIDIPEETTDSGCCSAGQKFDRSGFSEICQDSVYGVSGAGGLDDRDNVSLDREGIVMDVADSAGRCSPMSISSSDDDEEEGITLSLLHRILSKQTKDRSAPRTYPSEQSSRLPPEGVVDLARDGKKGREGIVSKTRPPKSYHDISDDDDEDASLVANNLAGPGTGRDSPEVPGTATRWADDSEPWRPHCGSSLESSSQSSSCNSKPARTKAKRSPEEIAASKLQPLEKRSQKEQAKQTKMRQQQEKKKLKEREAQVQKALREAHKAHRPEECMKYVTVVMDPLLLEDSGGAALLARLQELDCKTSIASQPLPGSVTWRRQVMEHNLGDDLQLNTLHQVLEEDQALIHLPVASFVDMVHCFKQEQQGNLCVGQESLREYAINTQQILSGKAVTFIIQGMEKYFRLQKNSKQRNFRSAVLGDAPTGNAVKARRKKRPIEDITTVVTRVDTEEALVDLQLHVGCNVRFLETPAEVADLVAMFTKSVAETPFKRERDKATFSFHVDTEWAGGVKVTKEGRGLLRVWRQQLQQFRNVSPEIASSIIAAYPSPRLLLQAYAQCDSIQEARKLLQDIVIRRGEGVLATTRRVGPELSRKVHTLMTSTEPNLAL